MGRGVSAGGGQSSLDYLFGGGENKAQTSPSPSKPVDNDINNNNNNSNNNKITNNKITKPATDSQIPAGIQGSTISATNNYHRADGQNCGNFITDRPSTKVHAAPGGGSSLGYLFGGKDK